jgi:hypothetical protein
MELVVVLAVLVSVTGIVVGLLPNMIHQANVPSCTANITELDKLIQTFVDTYSVYPDRMDNLLVGSSLASYVLTGVNGQYAQASIQADTLQTGEGQALTQGGMVNLANIIENPSPGAVTDWRPTFWPYSASQTTNPTFTPVADGTPVATLTQFGCQLMGLTWSNNSAGGTHNRYVIFGLGRPCTLFRNMASEPPSHFADTPTEDPATYYMRFGAVYQVSKEVTDASGNWTVVPLTVDRARFMGSVAFHDFGLATADSHTKEWWDFKKEERPYPINQ